MSLFFHIHTHHIWRKVLDISAVLWYDLCESRFLAAAVSDFSVGQRRSLLSSRGFRLPLFPTFFPPQFKYRTLWLAFTISPNCLIAKSFIPSCLIATQTAHMSNLRPMFLHIRFPLYNKWIYILASAFPYLSIYQTITEIIFPTFFSL